MLRLFMLVGVITAAVVATVSVASADGPVVLGKKHVVLYGVGWGTVRPRVLFNGGDPGGKAWHLRWSRWGGRVAVAQGLAWISRPTGNYYAKPGAIVLRAYRLGRCTADGPLAYTRLVGREEVRPGGAFTKWFAWGGWHSVCHGP